MNEEIDGTEKKKRSQKKNELRNSISDADAMSEGFMGGKTTSGCPLLDGIEKKCRGIDIMSGDASQDLLEACGVHQLCYLCVSFDNQALTSFLILLSSPLVYRENHSCSAIINT